MGNGFEEAMSEARRANVGGPRAESGGGVLEILARGSGAEPRPPKDFPAF